MVASTGIVCTRPPRARAPELAAEAPPPSRGAQRAPHACHLPTCLLRLSGVARTTLRQPRRHACRLPPMSRCRLMSLPQDARKAPQSARTAGLAHRSRRCDRAPYAPTPGPDTGQAGTLAPARQRTRSSVESLPRSPPPHQHQHPPHHTRPQGGRDGPVSCARGRREHARQGLAASAPPPSRGAQRAPHACHLPTCLLRLSGVARTTLEPGWRRCQP